MSWEARLRELEQQLAAGSLSPEQYRVARDDLLREHQSGAGYGAPAEPAARATPPQTPGVAQPESPAESTQVIRPVGQQDFPVDRAGAPSHGGGAGAYPATGTDGTQQDGGAPPWGGGDFAPVTAPAAGWQPHGANPFEAKQSHKGRRIVGAAVIAVLVVGLVVASVLYFTHRSDTATSNRAARSNQHLGVKPLPQPPQAKPKPRDAADALIDPPGKKRKGGGPFDLATLKKSNGLLPKRVVAALSNAGMTGGLLRTTTSHGVTIGLYALTVSDSSGAESVAKSYGEAQLQGGLRSTRKLSMAGVPVFDAPSSAKSAVYRAVYVLYDDVIIVEAFGPDPATTRQAFTQVEHDQVHHAPPTVRTQ